MAIHQINITASYEPDIGRAVIGFTGNFNDVVRGDTIQFNNNSSSNRSAIISGFGASRYDDSSTLTVPVGSSRSKVVLSNALTGPDSLSITTSSGGSKSVTVTIGAAADTYPDAFSFIAQNSAYPSVTYVRRIDWTGTNVAVTVQALSNCQVSPNGVDWGSSFSGGGLTGGRLYVRVVASSSFSTEVIGSVKIGTRTNTTGFKVTTFASYPAPKVIPLGITTGTIWLSDIQAFFGPSTWITGFYKNESRVPRLSPNNDKIPERGQGNINVSDFYGSATALYWLSGPPKPKYVIELSTGVNQTINAFWYGGPGQDFDVGFGSGIFAACEKRYVINYNYGTADFSSQSGNPTVFSLNNNWVGVAKTATAYEVAGTITIYIKHPKDTAGANILSHTFDFELIIAA